VITPLRIRLGAVRVGPISAGAGPARARPTCKTGAKTRAERLGLAPE